MDQTPVNLIVIFLCKSSQKYFIERVRKFIAYVAT